MRVLVAQPRGFCAGVDRAIDVVRLALEIFGPPIYVRHAIVHNRTVIQELSGIGARFVEDLKDVPEGATLIFSAHGIPPSVRDEAKARRLTVIDATCPLVTKVHLEAARYGREGYSIILVGHRGHVEVIGTSGEAPAGSVQLIEGPAEVPALKVPDESKVVVLTQTTLSIDDTQATIEALKQRFPQLTFPPKEDICYATTNRQGAVKALAEEADVVLVVGSPESSNSNRLREVAEAHGATAYLIENAEMIDPRWLEGVEAVGVTSGASAPEYLVEAVLNRLTSLGAASVEPLTIREERVHFGLPPEIVRAARARGVKSAIIEKHAIRPSMKMHT